MQRTAAPAVIGVAVTSRPAPDLAQQREHERRAAIVRLSSERDNITMDRDAAIDDPARWRWAETMLQHTDALLEALDANMIPVTRLVTWERSLAEFRRLPLLPLARRGLAHTGRGLDDVSKVVAEFIKAHQQATMPELRLHLRELAAQGHEVILAVGAGVRAQGLPAPQIGSLDKFPGLPRRAIGWRDADKLTLHTLRDDQLAKLVKRTRKRLGSSLRPRSLR